MAAPRMCFKHSEFEAHKYKTVELDEQVLGGGPAQFREVQDHESELFLSYFTDGGVEYLAGGVDSAFNHVERDTYKTRLLHC